MESLFLFLYHILLVHSLIEKYSFATRDQSQQHNVVFTYNRQVTSNNSVVLDHFPIVLIQQVVFHVTLDIVVKDHFPVVLIQQVVFHVTLNIVVKDHFPTNTWSHNVM